MSRTWDRLAWVFALVTVLTYVLVSTRHLETVPQVYEDEPWQASTGYKLMRDGVFGSDLFRGLNRMDQRYYGFLPLHPILLALDFRLLGLGLTQARLETVVAGGLILLLTFALGSRLYSVWVGAIAVVLLVFVRWTGVTYVLLSGIPLLDLSRIARYDPLVPVFGLAAMHAYISARELPSVRGRGWYFAAGILAGLAGLAHLYGVFMVVVLLILVIWDKRWPQAGWVLMGFGLVWLPYVLYVLSDLADWRAQTRIYADRFDLLNARWYLDNVAQEYHRYGPGLGALSPALLLRVGFWSALVGLPLSLIALARRADAAVRLVLVPAVALPVLFALFIRLKLVNYTLVELPFWALAIAWGLVTLWHKRAWARPVLGAIGFAVVLEGLSRMAVLEQAAATTTPYPTFIAQVRQFIPPGSRVLGLHTYWFGLQDFDYTSFLVPLELADPLAQEHPIPLEDALERVQPDLVLLDARMRDYFQTSSDGGPFRAWLSRHQAQVIGRVEDPTYGELEIILSR